MPIAGQWSHRHNLFGNKSLGLADETAAQLKGTKKRPLFATGRENAPA